MPDSVEVTFHCKQRNFKTWVCLEHGGYASAKAQVFVSRRFDNPPKTTKELIERYHESRKTTKIKVDFSDPKFPEVINTKVSFSEKVEKIEIPF